MGRRLRTTVLVTDNQLIPKWAYLSEFKRLNRDYKDKQKIDFDRRHGARDLPPVPIDTEVWISTDNGPIPGRIQSPATTPRSYVVSTPSGEVRRNRGQLRVVPSSNHPRENYQSNQQSQTPGENEHSQSPVQHQIVTRSRTGVELRPPDRLI